MGKRSDFIKIEKDEYQTIDRRAVEILAEHVRLDFIRYSEPCVGDGKLVEFLNEYGATPVHTSDIKNGVDALTLKKEDINSPDCIITNPPWTRNILHQMINHFSEIAPYTWLLFDADWAHTQQSIPYMTMCTDIISVGRLKWIPDTKMSGKDNCAWYRFEKGNIHGTKFHGRS